MWGPPMSLSRFIILLWSSCCCCLINSSFVLAEENEVEPTIHVLSAGFGENKTSLPAEYRHLPVVAKCCSFNEVLLKDGDSYDKVAACSANTSYYRFSPFFNDFNLTGIMLPSYEMEEFVALVGDPCRQSRYMLEPELNSEDEYYLLRNGSVYAPHESLPMMLMPGVDYCMDFVPNRGISVLVCFEDQEPPQSDFLITFYACGLMVSVPFLLLTIAAYAITPRLLDVHGMALCWYCGCLATAFTALALVQLASDYLSSGICTSIAFVIQFSFVACFFWLNVMCVETYLLVRRHVERAGSLPKIEPNRLFFYYSLWAWGPTGLLIAVSIFMDLDPMIPATYVKPNFGRNSCWFNSDEEAKPYFYVPVSLLVCFNFVLFGLTALEITRYQRDLDLRQLAHNQESDREERRLFRRLKRVFFVCLGLFFLMGINWAMELISWWAGGNPLAWSAFDLVNALQGILVFGLFVLRRPVRNIIWCRIQKLRGLQVTEPELGSMALYLLPVINADDSLPRERLLS